ncbi:hypothetical protein SAMN04489759_101142 [Sulfitobacter delicatus]|uniref:Uncharacterized protein n=1 Tax=Sulfitobacter delicatus TaxID=218672 RepID=A0A1G7HJJ8_9RHOB|nr:hypothetical protein SAMN04489759_101142 [Sulfitobacter delicatus]
MLVPLDPRMHVRKRRNCVVVQDLPHVRAKRRHWWNGSNTRCIDLFEL